MQCKLRLPLLQHMISISTRSMFPAPAPPSPADFDPFPAPPRTVGRGRFPAPPCPVESPRSAKGLLVYHTAEARLEPGLEGIREKGRTNSHPRLFPREKYEQSTSSPSWAFHQFSKVNVENQLYTLKTSS